MNKINKVILVLGLVGLTSMILQSFKKKATYVPINSSELIITGDESQVDLYSKDNSGLKKTRKILSKIEEITVMEFQNTDIVRNPIVSKILEIFPNPSNGTIFFNNTSNDFTNLKVFDLSGKLVVDETRIMPADKLKLNLNKGHYLIEITQNSLRTLEKIVILE